MIKSDFKIPQEVFEKEIRYKIMAKFLKRKVLAGDNETIFMELKMKDPIAIMGVRKPVSLEDFEKQRKILLDKNLIQDDGQKIKITDLGEEYAKSQKGESYSFLFDY
jgi:predicted methyltransferase